MIAPSSSAPAGADVVTLKASMQFYRPSTFRVHPGETVAIHLENVGLKPMSIALALPSGTIALKGKVKPNHDAFVVFNAPTQPGNYAFFDPLGDAKFVEEKPASFTVSER